MEPTRLSTAGTQARGGANRREDRTGSVLGQATEAARNVAESASDLAQDTYDRGARYVREGWDRVPDVGRYVRHPVEENPLIAILAAGAVGYLLAYLIHGSGLQWSRESVPDYARTRRYNGQRR
jgi:hypothetical protein